MVASSEGSIRADALNLLSRVDVVALHSSALPVIIECLRDSDMHVRLASAEAFAKCKYDLRSSGSLVQLLADRDRYVRVAATRSLLVWGVHLDVATARKVVAKAGDDDAEITQIIKEGLVACLSLDVNPQVPIVDVIEMALRGEKGLSHPKVRALCAEVVLLQHAAIKKAGGNSKTVIQVPASQLSGYKLASQGRLVKIHTGPGRDQALQTLETLAGGHKMREEVLVDEKALRKALDGLVGGNIVGKGDKKMEQCGGGDQETGLHAEGAEGEQEVSARASKGDEQERAALADALANDSRAPGQRAAVSAKGTPGAGQEEVQGGSKEERWVVCLSCNILYVSVY